MSDEIVKSEVEVSPLKTIQRGKEMAEALKSIVANKKGGLVINGERYLEFEDWQTLGRFFGYSVKTFDAQPVEVDGVRGAKARAEIVDSKTGLVIGSAEAYCLRDEPNWENKPFFQLASMAQTRAGAKALRNLLAWVAVLAGYKPTPAEEMETARPEQTIINQPQPTNQPQTTITVQNTDAQATEKQIRMIHVICNKKGFDYNYIKNILGVEHLAELNRGAAGNLITFLQEVEELDEDALRNAVGDAYLYVGG